MEKSNIIHDNQIDVLQDRFREHHQQVDGLQHGFEDHSQQINGLQRIFEGHSQEIGGLQNSLEGLSQQINGFQDRFRDHPQQIEELKQEVEAHSQQFNGLQDGFRDHSQQIGELQISCERCGGHSQQIRDLQNGFEDNSRQIGGLRESVQGLSQQIMGLQDKTMEKFRDIDRKIKTIGILGSLTGNASVQSFNQTPFLNPLQYLDPIAPGETVEQLQSFIRGIEQEYKDSFSLKYTISSIEICRSLFPEPEHLPQILNKLWDGLQSLNLLEKVDSLTIPCGCIYSVPNRYFETYLQDYSASQIKNGWT